MRQPIASLPLAFGTEYDLRYCDQPAAQVAKIRLRADRSTKLLTPINGPTERWAMTNIR
jgi:hypothetical protein